MAKKTKPAKRTKRGKRTKRKASKPPASVEPGYTVEFRFTDALLKRQETVRRLAHRVVEILADSGRDDRVAQFVTDNLAWLVEGFVIDKVTDLIEEARSLGKAVPGG